MLPKIYTKKQHGISLNQIDPDALYVIITLQKAGYTSYLVGGSIRDLLLGHTPKDFDISTSARPEEIKALFKGRCLLIGRRFRLAHIRFKAKIIEVATFRSGNTEGENLIIQDNTWGTPEEDVLRRDFKINGLFFDPTSETIIDYVGGFEDFQMKKLEVIGEPYIRFKQDPVRMIRLLKFLARFDLQIDEKMKIDFLECRQEILKSSQARILEEIMRMLHSGAASKFIRLMSDWGLLQQLLPELSSFFEHDPNHLIYRYLDEIDSMIKSHPQIKIDRSILIACLIFPLVDSHIKTQLMEKPKPPHSGQIQTVAKSLIDTCFHPFFQLSRKIKGEVLYLISLQYRLVPLKSDAKIHYRIPGSPSFTLGLKFLNLRARINRDLQPMWSAWKTAYEEMRQPPSFFTPRKRFRKKRRK
ncbi:MAG: polynucleotide adenylyltransferase PcnB [Simkaniaceae bacterium]|nr:polynucleotide adenylyltransferase PcnB [Simkaniaceae bacterium]